MCMIAGYAGPDRAAPILIEMLRKMEYFDGGRSTGIATVHEGKVYTAKINGNLDRFLRETDGADLPGNVGIIHSRTDDNLASHAHPFLSDDDKLALVLNGTMRDVNTEEFYNTSNAIMQDFFDRGFKIRTQFDAPESRGANRRLKNGKGYHDSEPYALMVGEYMAKHPEMAPEQSIEAGFVDALSRLPGDIVILGVHQDLPDTITVGTVTRPMHWANANGASYLATCPIGMPEAAQNSAVIGIPTCTIARVTSKGIWFSGKKPENVRAEQIDMRVPALFYDRLEALLTGKKDDPLSMYDFPSYSAWRDIWSEPYVECKFRQDTGLLKPYAAAVYQALWNFHTEGRLHSVLGERNGHPITKFWLSE